METFLTFEATLTYGCELVRARRMTEEEKKHIKPEYQEYMMVGVGEHVQLYHIRPADYPKRKCDGEFRGCANMAWIISREEWDRYIELDRVREEEKRNAERVKRLAELKKELARMERQGKLYTKEEALEKTKWYNNVFNEGGDGYIPHYYTQDEYDWVSAKIKELEADNASI